MITAIAFLKKNWQALAIVAIAGVIFIRVEILKSERDDALATIAEMHQEAIKKNAEVELLKRQGKRDTDALQASHIKDIQHIGALYGKQINDINSYRNELADRLRQNGSSGGGLPANDADKAASADSNTADIESPDADYKMIYLGAQEYIKLLEQAGAVCAADYNACKAYVDQEQNRIGVYLD